MKKIEHPSDIFLPIVEDLIDRYGKAPELPISSLPKMNRKIWGLRRKKLVVVAGRPSQGKSVFLLQTAFDLAKSGKKVVFISLEMTLESCVLRLMNAECNINNWANIAGFSQEDYQRHKNSIIEFNNKLETLDFVLVEGYGGTFEEIFKVIESLKVDIDAVFIDYVQMVRADNVTDKRAIDEYIKKLRNYAITKNFCAVIGSQINRGTHDNSKIKTPEMWEMKGSGTLEEVVDLCFLVHWQYFYTREKDIYNDYWIRVAKNRDGRTGVFECRYEPEFYRITEGAEDGGNTGTDGEERVAYRGFYND